MKYVIEPMQFALDEKFSEEDFLLFLKRLFDWKEHIIKYPNDFYVLSKTQYILGNLYPLKHVFDKMDSKFHHIAHGKDIDSLISTILYQAKKIDEECGDLNEELVDITACNKKQTELINKSDSLKQTLWYTNCHKISSNKRDDSYVVFASNINDCLSLTFNTNNLIEEKGNCVLKTTTHKMNIKCNSSIKDFYKDPNVPSLIWKNAETATDLDYGLRIFICQSEKMKNPKELNKICTFYIQDSFFEDYCDGHYNSRPAAITSIMESIRDAVLDRNQKLLHHERIKKTHSPHRILPNGYSALRRNCTTSFKLAFWKKGRDYWIANVKEHDFVHASDEFSKGKRIS